MLVNVNNVIQGLEDLIELNRPQIDTLVKLYQRDRGLSVLLGERHPVPNAYLPALMLEPTSSSIGWQYHRAQREDLNITCILEIWNGNEDLATEFIGLLTTLIGRIFMWPPYLQRRIPRTAFTFVDSKVNTLTYTTGHPNSKERHPRCATSGGYPSRPRY